VKGKTKRKPWKNLQEAFTCEQNRKEKLKRIKKTVSQKMLEAQSRNCCERRLWCAVCSTFYGTSFTPLLESPSPMSIGGVVAAR